MKKIEVYSGITPNPDRIGIDGYEFFGTFESFEHFREYLENLPDNLYPTDFIGFEIDGLYYTNCLEPLGNKEKAWSEEK